MPLPIQPTVQPDVSMLRRSAVTAPEEAIGLAAEVLHGTIWQQSPGWERRFAHAALAAAVPVIEKQLRARLASEVLADTDGDYRAVPYRQAMLWAARIVRGEHP